MIHRRRFLQFGSVGLGSALSGNIFASKKTVTKPVILSTWSTYIEANKKGWEILKNGGRALDAVEQGARVIEDSIDCCVGLGANPDRDGYVTLDACIMDEFGGCGGVAFLQRIKHPITIARRVMEKTPHVLLVGEGAQQFAVQEGFPLEPQVLSDDAKKVYEEWLKTSQYKPLANIENSKGKIQAPPNKLKDGSPNHDTVGIIALDANGNLSGACTTSGMAFKMHGRVGDSPIFGAGLFVDNEIGAATSTGVGEEVLRTCGTHLVVELMRQGLTPEAACKKAVERILNKNPKAKEFQVGFIALNKQGEYGGYCIQSGFDFVVGAPGQPNTVFKGKHLV